MDNWLGNINNEKVNHRIRYAAEIIQNIKYCKLKTIYCTKKNYNKLKKNIDNSLLNFNIEIIKSVKKGDSGDILKKKFKGIIGITYY